MAFFGLTQLGYQNTIKEYLKDGQQKSEYPKLPVIPVDQTSRYSGHRSSFSELRRLRVLNTRDPKGPREIYRLPLLVSHDYGFYLPTADDQNDFTWAKSERYPRVMSEMTK
ncbi:hypothetical protein FGIG_08430 [Fasciola gigantica]|uniref:Uncharacterized protein n=1 Tax=Fasciola gigantica TaxID=46835 RepID=A0A504YVI9_FASGI|nr:hypothetical protein FGIG_08430 [Fasciola gigantica]